MAAIHKLKAQQIAGLPDGFHSDGGNLYLRVRDDGASRSYVFKYKVAGLQRQKGLGRADPLGRIGLTLAEARAKADDLRAKLRENIDPIAEERAQKAKSAEANKRVPTFGEFTENFLATKENGWKNEKHRAQWRMTLSVYAAPLCNLSVDQISTDDVLNCLTPIWTTKPETASRTRGRIETVLNAARVSGHIATDAANPARFAGHLKLLLPAVKKSTKHHAALPYAQVPKFVAALRQRPAVSALAHEFIILTAARTGEVIEMDWSEIDLKKRLWTVPAARMKAERDHVVPLSPRAIQILEAVKPLKKAGSSLVFPGPRRNRGLSDMAFEALRRRMKFTGITTHGFRSSFRDWAGDETDFAREVAEAALAHAIGDKAEQAYRRGSAIEKRRALMEAWAKYCSAEQVDDPKKKQESCPVE